VSDVRELEYLDECVQSVAASNYRPLDLIVVDNASRAPLEPRVCHHLPGARLLPLRPQRCLAAACNAALARSDAPYALLMNPDVKLHRDCVARLVSRALANAKTAAVVPKTLLWRTPAFVNAIGNRVPPRGWGTDNGIGQLDLGQFDDWREAPSASLTIELLTRAAWLRVGPFDEHYPAYYEDADWAYRARLAGWTIAAEPSAQAFHIFGGFWDAPPEGGLSARKLTTAVVGRLRFACKIPSRPTLATLLRNYLSEDAGNLWASCRRRDWRMVRAYLGAWARVMQTAPRLVAARRRVQAARALDDRALFPPEAGMPLSCTHRNAPVLTAPLIRDYYAPFIRDGMTRMAAEGGWRSADGITLD
jgi:glycosyltransferase involved in cell wall biosynthesis